MKLKRKLAVWAMAFAMLFSGAAPVSASGVNPCSHAHQPSIHYKGASQYHSITRWLSPSANAKFASETLYKRQYSAGYYIYLQVGYNVWNCGPISA
jgi:hypothetical protein